MYLKSLHSDGFLLWYFVNFSWPKRLAYLLKDWEAENKNHFLHLFSLFCHIIFVAHSRKFSHATGPQLGSNQSWVFRTPYNSALLWNNYPFCLMYNKVTFTISSKVFLESSTARMYFGFGLSSMMFWITLEKEHSSALQQLSQTK